MEKGVCNYILSNGNICNQKTVTHKFICDEHAEKQELEPYGRGFALKLRILHVKYQ